MIPCKPINPYINQSRYWFPMVSYLISVAHGALRSFGWDTTDAFTQHDAQAAVLDATAVPCDPVLSGVRNGEWVGYQP